MPNYTVVDNQKDEVVVRVYVITPDGKRISVKENEYTFAERGVYTVIYMATDPNDNFVIYRFVVEAA